MVCKVNEKAWTHQLKASFAILRVTYFFSVLQYIKVRVGISTYTVFTWLNAAATITLVSKIGSATIQSQPPFDTEK